MFKVQKQRKIHSSGCGFRSRHSVLKFCCENKKRRWTPHTHSCALSWIFTPLRQWQLVPFLGVKLTSELVLRSWNAECAFTSTLSPRHHLEEEVKVVFLFSLCSTFTVCNGSTLSTRGRSLSLSLSPSLAAGSVRLLFWGWASYHSSAAASKADMSDICCVGRGPVRRRGRRRCCCELGWRTRGSPCTQHTVHAALIPQRIVYLLAGGILNNLHILVKVSQSPWSW